MFVKPILLCILDGFGVRCETHGNAQKAAYMPNYNYLISNYPHTHLNASGTFVGLPLNQMGNSEVGHMNIGTGRAVLQSIDIISNALKTGEFKKNLEFISLINHVKENNSNLHICGLLSDGGIHSHIDHLLGIIDVLKEFNVPVYFHIFTDGRDTKPHDSLKFIKILEDKIKEVGFGKIATVSGRYYSMDRDNRWDRIKLAYTEMTEDRKEFSDIQSKINEFYNNGVTDEFIKPFTVYNMKIKDNDGVLVFNFRPDRLRELFSALSNPSLMCFERKTINNLKVVTMMPIDKSSLSTPMFEHVKIDNYLGKIFESKGLKQLRIAETEKYPHVTYFFDGENKNSLKGCDQILVPSSHVATYDLEPQMQAYKITDILLEKMADYDFIVLNFAGGDMVGHTGNFEATVKALEAIDECIGKLYQKVEKLGGLFLLTADHGNCDYMLDADNNVITSHSMSEVPFIVCDKSIKLKCGDLKDIAPTILDILNFDKPSDMTGHRLREDL